MYMLKVLSALIYKSSAVSDAVKPKLLGRLFKLEFLECGRLIEVIRADRITYCSYPKLENICRVVDQLRRKKVPGIYIEAGVALGGSAIVIAKMKPRQAPLYLYDVYGLIPEPSVRDESDAHKRYAEISGGKSKGLSGDTYYGYQTDLKDKVKGNLQRYGLMPESNNIHLIEGLFENTLKIQESVAFAHIDCDWYDSVQICIDEIAPRISKGGVMVFDDYSSYDGCKKAVDQFLAENKSNFKVIGLERSLLIQKIS
jgi:hypothetical protein